MSSNKRTARIAGMLIIIGMVAGALSIVPSVESADYLTEVYPKRNQVLTGALFQFFLVPIYIGFSLVLYQVIRNHKESLAIGFVGFRVIAGVFQLIGVILLPIFIYLSQKHLNSTSSNLPYFENSGEILILVRDLTNHLGVMLATGLGNLFLYYIFFDGKYIPKWLSIWGIAGNILIMLASFLILFQLIEVISSKYAIMTAPLVLQEIVLAIWLIVKGLNLPITNQNFEKQKTNAQ